jgi:hypothetical protein
MDELIQGLLRHVGISPPVPKKNPSDWYNIQDGFYLDKDGVVIGRCIDLDINAHGHYSPIYYYNRSWRFIGLFNVYQIPIQHQGTVLRWFEDLEAAWENTKEKYDRVYFLTQKLILLQITTRLGIPSTQPTRRPISDLKRYKAQIAIFNDLWKIVVDNKCHNCTKAAKVSSVSSRQTVNCP